MKEKLRSFFVFVLFLQVLLMLGQMEGFVILRKIDKATQSNSKTLELHSTKLVRHDQQFDAIFESTFSKEFADKIRRNLNAKR